MFFKSLNKMPEMYRSDTGGLLVLEHHVYALEFTVSNRNTSYCETITFHCP